MARKFDILIVGAGPSGSMAADKLARSGVNVCLFDGRPTGEPKPCGGGVTTKAFKHYPHLLHALSRIVNKVYLYSPSGREVQIPLTDSFSIFSRTEFDSYLCQRAAEGGAAVIKKRARVELDRETAKKDWILKTPDGKLWSGQTIIAADGVNSGIARSLAGSLITQEMEVAFGYRSTLPTDSVPRTSVAFLPNWAGYAWAFPHLDHLSFGIATSQKSFDFQKLDVSRGRKKDDKHGLYFYLNAPSIHTAQHPRLAHVLHAPHGALRKKAS
jgi:flavin-dependent dehydrogenase